MASKHPKKVEIGDSLSALLEGSNEETEANSCPPVTVTCPPPIKSIPITRYALQKLFILAEEIVKLFHYPVEVYCLVFGTDSLIEDFIIPKQSSSSAFVHIDSRALLELSTEIREKNLIILGWAHSHANMGVFFSGTDDKNQATLLSETSNYMQLDNTQVKYVYGMTVNIRHDYFGVVSTQYPCGRIEHREAKIQITESGLLEWDESTIRSEIGQDLKEKIENSPFFRSSRQKKIEVPSDLPFDEPAEQLDDFVWDVREFTSNSEENTAPLNSEQNELIEDFLANEVALPKNNRVLLSKFLEFLKQHQPSEEETDKP